MTAQQRSKLRTLILVAIAVIAAAGIYLFIHRGEETTDDAAIDGRTVTISPKVSGYVITLNINDNQQVKAGDVMLEIDPADYILRRDRASAMLAAAKAQVSSAEATLAKSQADLKRLQHLSTQARSQEQLDQAIQAEKSAEATRDQLAAQVKQAEADLGQAEKDLHDTKIIAPMDGTVTKRGVERGDYVQPGQQLGALVGNDLWVIADYKETQIKHMLIGDTVDIRVDAFPDARLQGRIDSIQSGTGAFFSAFPPENASGNFVKIVQRIPVKITFTQAPDPKLHLGPGMSVDPVVHTGTSGQNEPVATSAPQPKDAQPAYPESAPEPATPASTGN